MISHETHPRDILIFDHTALAVAPASLLLSAILSFPFTAWGFHSSVHTTDQWLHKYVQKQNRHICTDWNCPNSSGTVWAFSKQRIDDPHFKRLHSNQRRSIPVWVCFFSGRIFVIGQERTAGWKPPQVKLGHVWQGYVDGSVVSEERTVSERPSQNNGSRISACLSTMSYLLESSTLTNGLVILPPGTNITN